MGKGKRNPQPVKRPAWSWFVFRLWLLATILLGGLAVLLFATGGGDALLSYAAVPVRAGLVYLWAAAGAGAALSSFAGRRLWTYGAPTVLCLAALLLQVSTAGPDFHGPASLFLLNLAAYSAFFFLFARVLDGFGFGEHLSVFATFVFLLLNRPFAAAMARPSFDLHALNLCLLGWLLWTAGRRNAAAAAFACAVPFQPLTAVFAGLFLCAKDLRRVGVYAGTLALLGAASCAAFGGGEVASAVSRWVSGWDVRQAWASGWMVRVFAAAALAFAEYRMAKCLMWKNRKDAQGAVFNICPFLFAVPLLAPPFGEARLVFAALPFAMLLKKLQKPGPVCLYLVSWLALFAFPLDLAMASSAAEAVRVGGCFALLAFAVGVTWSRIHTSTPFGTFKTRLDLVMGKGRIEY